MAKRGILSLDPYGGILCFPLDYGIPFSKMDALLHKATDSLEKVDSETGLLEAKWSKNMEEFQNKLKMQPQVCIIDEFSAVAKVIVA